MGLKGSGDCKKKWTEMGGRIPDDKITEAREEADFLVDDGTGRFYDACIASNSFMDIANYADGFLQHARTLLPNCPTYFCVLDVESLKPANKSVLRNEATKDFLPFTEEDVETFLRRCSFKESDEEISQKLEQLAPQLHAHEVSQGRAKVSQNPYKYLIGRMLRTHTLRNILFHRFITGIQRNMLGDFPAFSLVIIDGYPEVEVVEGKHVVQHYMVKIGTRVNERQEVEKQMVKQALENRTSGEADIRAIKIAEGMLRRQKAKCLYLRTRDTDLPPIALMGARATNGERDILIDLGPGSKNGSDDIFSMYNLAGGMYTWAQKTFPATAGNMSNAIAMICTVMILCGTDYVSKPRGLGFEKAWQYFIDIGHAFFQDMELPAARANVNVAHEWTTDFTDRARKFVMGLLSTDAKASKKIPNRNGRYVCMMARRKEIHDAPRKPKQKPSLKKTQKNMMLCIGKWEDVLSEAESRTSPQSGIIPENLDWINVYIAQTAWNMLYWNFSEMDCMAHVGGLPRWGWVRDEEDEVVRARRAFSWETPKERSQ